MTASAASSSWAETLKLLPGYDSFADAGTCRFDEAAADEACAFFSECLTHIEGALAGEPFALEPWQRAIVGAIFGWKRADGTRRYREVFIYVPRKNGKTPLIAGILNYVLFCDGEAGAQCYGAAADTDQAALLFRHAKGMVLNDEELAERGRIYDAYKSIVLKHDQASSYRVLSADAHTKHGGNSHFVVVDELHAQPNRDLVDVLQTSMASKNRRQPMLVFITTADFERESICNEKHDFACKVRDGIIKSESFLPVIYEASRDDDWTDEAVWEKANPNLDVSVSREYLRAECAKAKELPTYENTFKRLHLNIKTQQDVRWLPMEKWDECGTWNAAAWAQVVASFEGKECFAGLDLANVSDVAALALWFPEQRAVLPWFWVPREGAKIRERRDRVPYVTWINEGLITATDGNTVDYDVIRADINALKERFNIRCIAIDRWNSTQLQTQLMGDGFEVKQFGQGFASMTAPSKELERLVMECEIQHFGHPVMRWMASNAAAETDAAGNVKPSKKKSTEKIDGIVALVMGIGESLVSEVPVAPGLFFLGGDE